LDVRFVGQSHELTVDLPRYPLDADGLRSLTDAFRAAHRKAYGYAADDEPTELVNIRTTAVGVATRPARRVLEEGGPAARAARKGQREVYFHEAGGEVDCEIYDRYKMKAGNRIAGSAVVEEIDSTTVLNPGYAATVDRHGNLMIEPVNESGSVDS